MLSPQTFHFGTQGALFWSTHERSVTAETSYMALPRTCPGSIARVQEWDVCPTRSKFTPPFDQNLPEIKTKCGFLPQTKPKNACFLPFA